MLAHARFLTASHCGPVDRMVCASSDAADTSRIDLPGIAQSDGPYASTAAVRHHPSSLSCCRAMPFPSTMPTKRCTPTTVAGVVDVELWAGRAWHRTRVRKRL